LKILSGSTNPVKIGAVREAFSHYFSSVEVIGLPARSGVSSQPIGDEAFAGAEMRARSAWELNRAQSMGAAYCAGLEGGIAQLRGRWVAFGGVCLMDAEGRSALAASAQFELPPGVVQQVLSGAELGDVMDALTGERDTKQAGGAAGILSHGILNRQSLYTQAVIAALIPFINPVLYRQPDQAPPQPSI
jgi:inosine/xanthosine triphosphatase